MSHDSERFKIGPMTETRRTYNPEGVRGPAGSANPHCAACAYPNIGAKHTCTQKDQAVPLGVCGARYQSLTTNATCEKLKGHAENHWGKTPTGTIQWPEAASTPRCAQCADPTLKGVHTCANKVDESASRWPGLQTAGADTPDQCGNYGVPEPTSTRALLSHTQPTVGKIEFRGVRPLGNNDLRTQVLEAQVALLAGQVDKLSAQLLELTKDFRSLLDVTGGVIDLLKERRPRGMVLKVCDRCHGNGCAQCQGD